MATIDLRSDTVTHPSPSMRKAMYEAELGDDVYGEDPTINRLEALAASRLGKEAGLFVPSGSMGNLVSVLTHCGRGAQVICGTQCHIYHYEQGSSAICGGLHLRALENQPDGSLDLKQINAAIEPEDVHYARTKLICLENTWNGIPLTLEYTASVAAIAKRHAIKMHLDGARLFNAAVALGCGPDAVARHFDSVTFCLSKGLSAPVGSVICAGTEFINEARRNRKMLGGGMRQAGILAAAGIVGLNEMVDRLTEDHANARVLGEGLANIAGVKVDLSTVKTNMVFFSFDDPAIDLEFAVKQLENAGVLTGTAGTQIRAVTHYGITREHINTALSACQKVLTASTFASAAHNTTSSPA